MRVRCWKAFVPTDNAKLEPKAVRRMPKHEERWRQIYRDRKYETRFPFDSVVSFTFRHAPKNVPRDQVKVLDLGCGLGNNLRFLAQAGFCATGIDISPEAVGRADDALKAEGHLVTVLCCSCADLPFPSEHFDMIIDRGTMTTLPDPTFGQAFDQIFRVLKPDGHFLFTPFADIHSANELKFSVSEGLLEGIVDGHLGVRERGLRFVSYNDIRELFRIGWDLKSLLLVQASEMVRPNRMVDAEWQVVAQKR